MHYALAAIAACERFASSRYADARACYHHSISGGRDHRRTNAPANLREGVTSIRRCKWNRAGGGNQPPTRPARCPLTTERHFEALVPHADTVARTPDERTRLHTVRASRI